MEKEKVKLDEVLKFLFSTSNKVLVKLLNGIFDEKFDVDEVELTVSNNEFVEDDLGILRGDMFFDILNKNHNKASYHIEFQTKNDNTMVIRMFEYGFKKGKEQLKNSKKFKEEIKTIYFPKQKVIFFEENKSIENQLKLKIIFPDEQEIIYTVDVIKYWEYTDKELKEKKMYPLMPLQLFNLRKELEKAHNKNDLKKIKELSKKAKNLAEKLAKESAKLFEEDEILGEDFHKMLLAIQNLIEYLNRNYMKDENIENEVNKMTKTLYDPEVEKRGIEKGIKQGIKQGREQGIKSAIEKMLLKGMKEADVANILDTDISLVKEILKKIN
ncbi:hypothetical protein [uncultured Clostridium sp.]|uniref:hypothetical protein n=1 Tax=uncultured Clostridium sp. TaxID=59620 RepID=UPI00263AAA02|nr:hypothetical protein [uncultured Clostridium sp.]